MISCYNTCNILCRILDVIHVRLRLKMNYNLAIFDLDGTILNTIEDLADALNYALDKHGYAKRTLKDVLRFVGNGVRRLIISAITQDTQIDATEEEINTVYETFTTYYKVHCMDKTKPYKGIHSLIHQLRDSKCMVAVLSNKDDYAVQMLCDKYFTNMFDIVMGSRLNIRRKPYPDALIEILHLSKNKRDSINNQKSVIQNDIKPIYIGDSEVDIQTADNAGIDQIIVDWGFRDRDYLKQCGAKRIVSKPEEIYNIIMGI